MKVCTITTRREFPNPDRIMSFVVGNVSGPDAYHNEPNIGVVPAMQLLFERNQDEDILCFVHDDVTCYDRSWVPRVIAEFNDPKVAIVGFGGATGIGVDDIYKRPYEITQLQRIGYASNAKDAEVHGAREIGSKNVAVLDGYFMAVRTSFLKEIGGFKWFPHLFHCYDTALCLMAHRKGYKVRMVGVDCHHWGASHSASPEYKKWCLENGTTMEREHYEPHVWMYNEFRDLLPVRITDEDRQEAPTLGEARTMSLSVSHQVDAEIVPPKVGKCNIVMVTNGARPELLEQEIKTLYDTTPVDSFTLTVVWDGRPSTSEYAKSGMYLNSQVVSVWPPIHIIGRLKNLGAYWSEKQFGRGEWLCFIDDDMAFFPGWMEKMANHLPSVELLGSVRHPYHQPNNVIGGSNLAENWYVQETDAVAGYCHFMRWDTWDQFGPYDGHAKGTGQSEDWKLCNDIVAAGHRVGYIHPPVMAHCGITNSEGKTILGADQIERVPGVLYE